MRQKERQDRERDQSFILKLQKDRCRIVVSEMYSRSTTGEKLGISLRRVGEFPQMSSELGKILPAKSQEKSG